MMNSVMWEYFCQSNGVEKLPSRRIHQKRAVCLVHMAIGPFQGTVSKDGTRNGKDTVHTASVATLQQR